jgi:hypothetical protein
MLKRVSGRGSYERKDEEQADGMKRERGENRRPLDMVVR